MTDISLSHSSLQQLQSCPLKYYLNKIERRELIGHRKGIRRGSAFSDALEHRDVELIDKIYEKHLMDATEQWLVDELVQERITLPRLYRAHVEMFGDDQVREVEFEFPIAGIDGYVSRGRLDAVNIHGDVLMVEEDKLLSMWSASDERALPMNGQVLRYLDAARRLYPDKEIELRYRVNRWPGTHHRVNESASDYAHRAVEAIDKKVASGDQFAVKVLRLSDPVTREIVDRYITDLTYWALEEQARRKSGRWPGVYGEACKSYGGCEYLRACKQEPGYENKYTIREERK